MIDEVKNQYLAHAIRCMEAYLRQKTNNPMFQIITSPIRSGSGVLNVGCAQYFEKKYFSIFFDPDMDEKQLRVCLSHELGHLFIVEILNDVNPNGAGFFDETTLTEPLSSIFGIFTMMDKNYFYSESVSKYQHLSFNALIEDFKHLQNRLNNTSVYPAAP
jgi:hypothetical protein